MTKWKIVTNTPRGAKSKRRKEGTQPLDQETQLFMI